MIAQPQYKRTCRVIAQNQSASRLQDFLYAVKKVLWIRIVMKAVGTDNRVETVFFFLAWSIIFGVRSIPV